MKKYGVRFGLGILVFFFFKLTESNHWMDFFVWNVPTTIFLIYTVIVFLILWEVVIFLVSLFKKKESFQTNRGFYRVFFKAFFSALPFIFAFAYFFVYQLKSACCSYYENVCRTYNTSENFYQFGIISAQCVVISLLIISSDIIRLYISNAVNSAREKELIQKELIEAKFEGLKNQVNPHFLFNSFSVLTWLIEHDTGKAVKFIDKLSDMYRYILDTDEKDLVPMQSELEFLGGYEFLLKMRHGDSIKIENKILWRDEHKMVPPMSLQILVENAVKHNAFSINDPLLIKIYSEGDDFVVVENIKRPKVDLAKSTGIGLKNLSKRLNFSIKKKLEVMEGDADFRVKLPVSILS